MPETKQERSAMSTGKLLDAAAELAAEVGYERMTLAAIGRRAGYSHGLVTARFGSKEGLLWALVERMVDAWQIDLEATMADEPRSASAALRELIDEMRRSWSRHPKHMLALYGLMFEALLPIPLLNERMRDLHRQLRADLELLINHDITHGQVPKGLDSVQTARLVVGGIRGAMYQSMLDPDEISVNQSLDDLGALVALLLPTSNS